MSDEHKPLQPAEAAPIAMPPALVELAKDDPEVLVQLARGQLAIIQDRLVNKVLSNPDASVSQYVAVHERLSKIARIEGDKPLQSGGGQQVVINIIRAPGREKVVIEGEAKRVEVPVEPA